MVLPSYSNYPVMQLGFDVNVRKEDIISYLGAFIWNQREYDAHYIVSWAILVDVGILCKEECEEIGPKAHLTI